MARKKAKKSKVTTKRSKAKVKKSKPNTKRKNKASAKRKVQKTRSVPKQKALKRKVSGRGILTEATTYETRGLGANSAGQSGDTQGLPKIPVGDSDSVEELLEEGQAFEAEVLDGVENAGDADRSEVKTRQVPEDDVPEEYLEKD